jgi:hypothetical protein
VRRQLQLVRWGRPTAGQVAAGSAGCCVTPDQWTQPNLLKQLEAKRGNNPPPLALPASTPQERS